MVDGAKSNLAATSSGNLLTANTTYYINPAGSMGWGTTEAHHQHRVRRYNMQYSNAYIEVSSNGITTAASTVVSRNNNLDGNMSISIPASATGNFEDTVSSDTVTIGNYFGWKFTPGAAAGQMGFRAFICTQTPLGAATADITITKFMATQVNQTVLNTATASATGYICIHGETSAVGTGVETASQITVRKAGTLANLEVYISANARTTPTVYTVRKNVADTLLTVSVGSTATGIFEDITNTVSVAVGDEINYKLVTGTGTQNLNLTRIGVLFESSARITIFSSGATPGFSVAAALTTYVAVTGRATHNTTESIPQILTRNQYQISNLGINISVNAVSDPSTVRFRINAANGNLAASITGSTTGIFEDVSNTDNIISVDQINYQIVAGATGTSFTVRTITCHALRYTPVLYPVTINEGAITIGASTIAVKAKRILHEPVPPNNYALQFAQASTQHVNCGTTALLKSLSEVSISGWFKISVNPPTTFEAVFSAYALMAYINTLGQAFLTARYSDASQYFQGFGTPAKNVWHHIACSHSVSNSRTRFYFNGVKLFENTTSLALASTPTYPFYIGATPTGSVSNTYNFEGLIDHVEYYNLELTEDEIGFIYRGGLVYRGQVARFDLNEGTGSTTIDKVSSIVGTLVNTPIWVTDTPLAKSYSLSETVARKVKLPIVETTISLAGTVASKVKRPIVETGISLAGTLTRRLLAKKTMSETAISLAGTLTRRLSARRTISESAISLAGTLTRRLLGKRTITESGISFGDTLTRRLSARRTISETAISLGDTLTRRLLGKRTINESGISLADTLTTRLLGRRTITEPGVSIADNITSLVRRVRTITESAISLTDSVLLRVKLILEDLVTVDADTLAVTPPAATITSSILTCARGNFGSTGATTAGATQYWYCGNGMLFPSTTEANRQIPWHTPGVFSKLYIRVIASTTSANSTVVLRKNGVDQALAVTIGAGSTGPFENTLNEITIADGDNVCLKTVSGGTGTLTFSIMSVLFEADTNTITKEIAMGRAATTSGSTQYLQISGDRSGTSAIEANMESRMKAPGIYKNARIYVSANAKTTDTVVTFRKNRTDTAITWVIAAGFVGIKEDTTNTVSVAAEDEVDWKVVYATDTANITIENLAIDFESTDRIHFPVAGSTGATSDITQDFGTTNYYAIGGAMREVTVESEQKLKPRLPFTYFGLTLHAQVNTCNGATTIKFRKNGADGNQLITIPATTAGWQSDDINLDPVLATDEIDIEVTTAGTSGTLTIRNMSLMSQGLLVGVAYFRTITEPVGTVGDTLTSALRQARTITEGAIVILDSITRRLAARKTISEPVVSISDTIAVAVTYLRTITEGIISISDSLLLRVRLTITELQSIADSIVPRVTILTTITESAVSLSDTLTRKYYSLRTIFEGTIPTTDSINVAVSRAISDILIISDSITRRLRFTINELGITIADNIPTQRLQSRRIIDETSPVTDIISKRLSAKRTIDEIGQTISDYLLVTFAYFASITEPAIEIADNIPIIRVFIGFAKKGRRFFRHLGFGSTSLRRG